jgi:hypothetical protein
LKGERGCGAALVEQTAENRSGRFAMEAERQRRARRRFRVDNVNKAERELFELLDVCGRMHRSLDKLVHGRAKQRRINDLTLFIGVHYTITA